jgi:protein-tyrosine phosphatase
VNLRDLAGLRLTGGGAVPPGLLYRSDAPYPGDAAPETVPVWPPGTVIDLRSPGEAEPEASYQWPDGVTVHQAPMFPEAAVVRATQEAAAAPLPRSLEEIYRRLVDSVPDRLAALLAIVAGATAPVLVHCTAGKDRTGIAVAVLLLAGGAEPDDVIADYIVTGPNMPALIERQLALGPPLPREINPASELLAAPATAITVVTEHLTGWPGGPQAWALAHGASAADLRRWRERLASTRGRR